MAFEKAKEYLKIEDEDLIHQLAIRECGWY